MPFRLSTTEMPLNSGNAAGARAFQAATTRAATAAAVVAPATMLSTLLPMVTVKF